MNFLLDLVTALASFILHVGIMLAICGIMAALMVCGWGAVLLVGCALLWIIAFIHNLKR